MLKMHEQHITVIILRPAEMNTFYRPISYLAFLRSWPFLYFCVGK
jgi:hypothetical protein